MLHSLHLIGRFKTSTSFYGLTTDREADIRRVGLYAHIMYRRFIQTCVCTCACVKVCVCACMYVPILFCLNVSDEVFFGDCQDFRAKSASQPVPTPAVLSAISIAARDEIYNLTNVWTKRLAHMYGLKDTLTGRRRDAGRQTYMQTDMQSRRQEDSEIDTHTIKYINWQTK